MTAKNLARAIVLGVYHYDGRDLFDPTRDGENVIEEMDSLDHFIGRLVNGFEVNVGKKDRKFLNDLTRELERYGVSYGRKNGVHGSELDPGTSGPGWTTRPEWRWRALEVHAMITKEVERSRFNFS